MLLDSGPNGEVTLFCTTMLLEYSHNRLRDMFGRPRNRRVDEVIFTICEVWMPKEIIRLYALIHVDRGIQRQVVKSSWRDETAKQLCGMAQRSADLYLHSDDDDSSLLKQDIKTYNTDPVNFLCGLHQYQWFRRRICHHILAFYDPSLFIPSTAKANPKIQRLMQEI